MLVDAWRWRSPGGLPTQAARCANGAFKTPHRAQVLSLLTRPEPNGSTRYMLISPPTCSTRHKHFVGAKLWIMPPYGAVPGKSPPSSAGQRCLEGMLSARHRQA